MPLNWSQTVDLDGTIVRPTQTAEVVAAVRSGGQLLALGSAHSFSSVAATPGRHIATGDLPPDISFDDDTVTVGAGTTYAVLGQRLHEHGRALAAMASLPHITVGGAIATGTHGSGDSIGTLSSAVTGLEIVTASGDVRWVDDEDADFAGWVVALGALGIVTRVRLATEPTYDVTQSVYTGLDLDVVAEHFDDVFSAATSVSVFTRWRPYADCQWWLKQRTDQPGNAATPARLGAQASPHKLHPLEDLDPVNCTEQLGQPGPWHERLPHFRAQFTPSSGEEIQAEYLLPREHAAEAIRGIRQLHERITPLLHVTEIRTMCADDLWLSPAHGRDTVGIHFTWHRDERIYDVLPAIEAVVMPLGARPHWGKVSALGPREIAAAYPEFARFAGLMDRVDPSGIFCSPFVTGIAAALR